MVWCKNSLRPRCPSTRILRVRPEEIVGRTSEKKRVGRTLEKNPPCSNALVPFEWLAPCFSKSLVPLSGVLLVCQKTLITFERLAPCFSNTVVTFSPFRAVSSLFLQYCSRFRRVCLLFHTYSRPFERFPFERFAPYFSNKLVPFERTLFLKYSSPCGVDTLVPFKWSALCF